MPRMGRFLWLVLPSALVTVAFVYLPFFGTLGLGFLRMETLISRPEFVGYATFERVLRDPLFWRAFANGLIYAVGAIGLQLVLGISFALALNERFRGRGLLRAVMIFPYVVPTVVGVMVWRWILNENTGIVTKGLEAFGIHVPWLSHPAWAMMTVILISVWIWTPFVTVTVLAALQTVSLELYECARLDGAGPVQRFWHVTLPGIAPVLVVVALLRGIWMFNKFDVIYLATGGGPLFSTVHLPILSYKLAFEQFDLSGGAAVSVMNCVFLIVIVLLYLRLVRRWTRA